VTDAVRPLVREVTGGAGALRPVAHRAVAWLVARGLDPARAAGVELAIHEVLANAFEHGHLADGSVPIGVQVASAGSGVDVEVTDHALAGRWATQLPGGPIDAPPPARLPATRGRGVALAASAVDVLVVHAEDDRTVVTLRLELP